MTLLGILFIPAVLVCFLFRPLYLLPLLVIASVFEAGAIFNGQLGDFNFGIQPFYLVEIFICLHLAMLSFGREKLLPSKQVRVRGIVIALCAFGAWCCFSAFVMPHLFAGMPVLSSRNEVDEFVPLQLTLSNLAQAGYLTLNVGTVIYAVHMVRTRVQAEQLMKALYWAVFIVAIFGFAQFLAAQAGWDFPYELVNNNSGYAQGTEQDVGSIRRVNGTFMEPSMAGSYLAAMSCGLLAGFLSSRRQIRRLVAFLGVLSALLLTTSTTGLATLAAGVCLLLLYFRLFRRHEPSKTSVLSWVLVLLMFAVVGYIVLSSPDFLDAVMASTVEKGESYSYWSRLAKEMQSLVLFVNTYGLGVGLGSNRSSGLITTMLSSVGLVGTSLFALVLYRIGKLFSRISPPRSLQVGFWALLTMILSGIVGVPDINRPVLWCLLMIVVVGLNVYFNPRPSLESAKSPRMAAIRSPLQGNSGIAQAH